MIESQKNVKIVKLSKCLSTNSYALNAIDDLSDGTIVSADIQESGRGRLNRKWISDVYGNAYLSIVLKPKDIESAPLQNVTQYMATVVLKTLEEYGLKCVLKWPNDVLCDDKKICGILSEIETEKGKVKALVLGVGVNLNMPKETLSKIDQPATSVNIETGEEVDKDAFIEKLIANYFDGLKSFMKNGFEEIKDTYMAKSAFLDKMITVKETNGEITGKAIGFTDKGLLILKAEGEDKIIVTGDVVW